MLKKINSPLILIVFLALVLRLVGINHGYPFIFHPDEATIIQSALGIRFEINPGHFDWPHFYIYLNYFLYMVFAFVRNLLPNDSMSIIWNDGWIFYLLTRILTATLGALTVLPIYYTGKNLFNKYVGFFSALTFAILPFHIWHSHYALSDVPMVFLLSIGLYYASKIFTDNTLKYYILSGLFVGLSASTKYNGGLSALLVPTATILNSLKIKGNLRVKDIVTMNNIKLWSISGISAVIGFLIGTPFALFDYDTFSRTDGYKGAFWQFSNVGSVSFFPHVYKFFYNILFKISDDLGYTVLSGFLCLLILFIYNFKDSFFTSKSLAKVKKVTTPPMFSKIPRVDMYSLALLLSMGVFLIWYISGFEKSRSHYYMIAYPFIAVSFGYFLSMFRDFKSNIVKVILYVVFLGIPFTLSVHNSYLFYKGDTRLDLYNWVSQSKPALPVIYDFNDLDMIFYKSKEVKFSNGFRNMTNYNEGYVIITEGDVFTESSYKLSPLVTFDTKLKKGPMISIYKFEK